MGSGWRKNGVVLCPRYWYAEEEKGVGCGRHENYGMEERTRIRNRIWDPGIKRNFSRPHLEDKVISKEWGMIRPGLYVMLYLFRICLCVVLGKCHCLGMYLSLACFTS